MNNSKDNGFSVDTPKVSIGMPVFNGELYLIQAIESVLSQSFLDFELIISDNASSDQTYEICERYSNMDSRIRYYRQKNNIGGLENFSFVLKKARGPLFTWLAHDDALNSQFLTECVTFLENNHNTILVTGDIAEIDINSNEIKRNYITKIRSTIPWKDKVYEFFHYPISNVFFCIYGMYRTEKLRKAMEQIRFGPLMAASELPLLSRIASMGEIESIPLILRKYRFHNVSAYHVEKMKLKKSPIKGILLRAYNRWWIRFDQAFVLVKCAYPLRFKFHIIYNVSLYYLFTYPKDIIGTYSNNLLLLFKK